MYRIEINIGKPDAPRWKLVWGRGQRPVGCGQSGRRTEADAPVVPELDPVNGACCEG